MVHINLYVNLLFLAKYKHARYPLLSNHREVMVKISLLIYTCRNTDLNFLPVTARIIMDHFSNN